MKGVTILMEELIYFVRVIIAAVCGLIIGYERKNRAKEAGIRTHCIVACAAALMMVVSKYGFFDLIGGNLYPNADVKLDPSRVASGIVSGIGFLGAGMIFVQKKTIKGLTTAAGVWATVGIGMAIGSGMYVIGILVTLLILFIQTILHKDSKLIAVPHYKTLTIKNVNRAGYQEELISNLKSMNVSAEEIEVSHSTENIYSYTMTIEIPSSVNEEQILSIIGYEASLKQIKEN